MEQAKVYLDLSDEVRNLLKQYGVTVDDILQEVGIEAAVSSVQMPTSETRNLVELIDVTTLMVASSVGVLTLAGATATVLKAISDFLDRKCRRQMTKEVSYQIVEEIRDADGNPILDKDGKAQLKLTPVHAFITPEISVEDSINQEIKSGPLVARLGFQKDEQSTNSR